MSKVMSSRSGRVLKLEGIFGLSVMSRSPVGVRRVDEPGLRPTDCDTAGVSVNREEP